MDELTLRYREAPDLAFVKERIHNYFFAKALDKVRPGGYVVFVTAHGTLDTSDATDMRKYLEAKADMIGAVRLPDTAFKGVRTS